MQQVLLGQSKLAAFAMQNTVNHYLMPEGTRPRVRLPVKIILLRDSLSSGVKSAGVFIF
jgi:hypothetical protein